jgi:hypothetical protein
MLSPEQKLLAEEISYMPLNIDEMAQQFHMDVTYNPFTNARASQKAGDVYKDKNRVKLRSGCSITHPASPHALTRSNRTTRTAG